MANLTSKAVHEMMLKCLFPSGTPEEEMKKRAIIVDGITVKYGFDPEKIEQNRDAIRLLLADLPDAFMVDKGGGMSFLQACMTKDGEHWGEHPSMGALFALGQAAGFVTCPMPRELWSIMPGGMPYYCVDLNAGPRSVEGALGFEPR